MITTSIEYKDVENEKELLSSPMDSPPQGDGGETVCGLSATTSENSSQPNSWSSRRGSPVNKGRGAGLSSYMPIVDEEDCTARDSPDGHTSSEEEQPVSPLALVEAFHKAAYQEQVHRWQQVESFYMKHEDWTEHRVILLLQEAFRCSYANLKQARDDGSLSGDVFAARVAELRSSLKTIKAEYRRTLTRTKERHGDLSSIASKAVTCVASVYPWSSGGFVLGFEENLKYGNLVGATASTTPASGARRAAPPVSPTVGPQTPVVVVPSSNTAVAVPMAALEPEAAAEAACDEGDDLGIAESVVAGGRARRVATPRVSLRPLPPRRQLFQPTPMTTATVNGGEHSPVVSPSRSAAPATASFSPSSPQGESWTRRSAASPASSGPQSPAPLPPSSVTGPVRAGEGRFLEKRQLVVHGAAFVSHSLASTSFIASRRAAIAAATMRQRLGLAKSKSTETETKTEIASPSFSTFTTRTEAPPQPASPQQLSPVIPSPSLPTRYLTDVLATPSESAAFDSNPNSVTRRNNTNSAVNRPTLADPPVMAVPAAATASRSLPSSATARAVPSGNNSNSNAAAVVNNSNPLDRNVPCYQPAAYRDPANEATVHSQPHSYSNRMNVSPPVMPPSQPHSYTTRSLHHVGCAGTPAMPTPPYAATIAASCSAYPQPIPPTNGFPLGYAVPAAPMATIVNPLPPPGYSSHVRRDRMRAQPMAYPSSYSAMPPVSAADDQYVKELW